MCPHMTDDARRSMQVMLRLTLLQLANMNKRMGPVLNPGPLHTRDDKADPQHQVLGSWRPGRCSLKGVPSTRPPEFHRDGP